MTSTQAPEPVPVFEGVPALLRDSLVRIHAIVHSHRPIYRDLMLELGRARVAYTDDSCGCATLKDRETALWLHTNHKSYSETVLALLDEDARKRLFGLINRADPAVDAPGFWNAANVRRLQDWLAACMPKRFLMVGNESSKRQGRRAPRPPEGPKDP